MRRTKLIILGLLVAVLFTGCSTSTMNNDFRKVEFMLFDEDNESQLIFGADGDEDQISPNLETHNFIGEQNTENKYETYVNIFTGKHIHISDMYFGEFTETITVGKEKEVQEIVLGFERPTIETVTGYYKSNKNLEFRDRKSDIVKTVKTDNYGNFEINNLPLGNYTVIVGDYESRYFYDLRYSEIKEITNEFEYLNLEDLSNDWSS